MLEWLWVFLEHALRIISPENPVLNSVLLNIVSHKSSLLLDEEYLDEALLFISETPSGE